MVGIANEKLWKLYELAINEEHHFLDAHQNRVAFYSGFLSALVVGTIAGFFQADKWYHLAFLCVGPVLIFALSAIAIKGTSRLYQRFLEAVTVRAKIEQELGLTEQPSVTNATGDSYWRSESIIPFRHTKSRKDYECSDAFITEHSTKGYQRWTIWLFCIFMVIGISMLVGILLILRQM